MRPRLVCDASAVVAVLLDAGPNGRWAAETFAGAALFAPALMPFECANVIRRQESTAAVTAEQAIQAHADLLDLNVELWPYEVLASRVWELRGSLTSYDASYVALAEVLNASLITLDRRIGRAAGPRCPVLTGPSR